MTKTITDHTRLTVVKHLAAGKTPDVVAAITRLDRHDIVDIGSHHGYPDTEKLGWAADILQKKLDDRTTTDGVTEGSSVPATALPRTPRPTATTPAPVRDLADRHPATQAGAPDELRALINAGKNATPVRIQRLTTKILDDFEKLRALLLEDDEKHREQRAAAAAKEKARAEVARLEQQLRAAKAALRSDKPARVSGTGGGTLDDVRARTTAILDRHGVTSRDVRAWAVEHQVPCPATGMLPTAVVDAYDQAHTPAAAS